MNRSASAVPTIIFTVIVTAIFCASAFAAPTAQALGTTAKQMLDAAKSGDVDGALSLLQQFESYPASPEASQARYEIAKALRKQNRSSEAADLLVKIENQDPFCREAPDALQLLADIYQFDLSRPTDASRVLAKVACNYYPAIPVVAKLRQRFDYYKMPIPDPPISKKILLDQSLSESSIFDRSLTGSCNFGDWEVIKSLTSGGFTVHANDFCCGMSRQTLTPQAVAQYSLIILNGRYGADSEPPIPAAVIDTLVNYVSAGGNLIIIAEGATAGSGKCAAFYNPLASRFSLTFAEGRNTADSQHMKGTLADHPAVKGLSGFDTQFGVPVEGGLAIGFAGKDPVLSIVQMGKGKVIAAGLGSGLMGNTIGLSTSKEDTEKAARNLALINQLARYLTGQK